MTSAANEDETREQAVDWLMRVQASPDDRELRAALDRWLAESAGHRAAYGSVQRMWRVAGDLPGKSPAATREVAATAGADGRAILSVTQLSRRSPLSRPATRRIAVAMALAACLLLAFFPAIQLRLQADAITSTAELRDLLLEDGSEVHLDAGSAVAVDYGAARREVTLLAGEAFFEVVRGGRPFVVKAGNVIVTVVGTAFSVRTWEDAVSVSVKSGTVEVAVDGGLSSDLLTRGQRLRVRRGGGSLQRDEIVPDDIAAWRQRRLIVDGAPLADVAEALGRHYEGVIVLRDQAMAARHITGVFDLGRPVEALEAIARAQHGSLTRITPYLTVVSGP